MGRKKKETLTSMIVWRLILKCIEWLLVLHNKTLLIELAILTSILEGSNRPIVEVCSLLKVLI